MTSQDEIQAMMPPCVKCQAEIEGHLREWPKMEPEQLKTELTQFIEQAKDEKGHVCIADYDYGDVVKRTELIENTFLCPMCGRVGQLKRRTTKNRETFWFQVDHFKGKSHGLYISSCYLGCVEPEEIQLQKRFAYNYGGKEHHKFIVTIPSKVIQKVQWNEEDKIQVFADKARIILFRKSVREPTK